MRRGIPVVLFLAFPLFSLLTGGDSREASAIVTSFSGSVTLERAGEHIVLDAMLELYEGDIIEVGVDGNMVILYPSGKFRSIGSGSTEIIEALRSEGAAGEGDAGENGSAGKHFEPLFAFKAAAERLEGRKGVRATDTTGIHIFSPGNSSILEAAPDFVWGTVAEADAYTIELQRMGKSLGTAQIEDTFLNYPSSWQVPEPEKSYVVKVEALKDNEAIQSKVVRFKVVSQETKEMVEKERDGIMASAPDEISTYLLLGELYKKYKLYGHAIEVLQMLTVKAPDIPEFHRSLAEIYKSFGLARESNQAFERYESLLKGH